MFTATLFDPSGITVEGRDFPIAEHAAEWIASYLTRMAEDGLAASGRIEPRTKQPKLLSLEADWGD